VNDHIGWALELPEATETCWNRMRSPAVYCPEVLAIGNETLLMTAAATIDRDAIRAFVARDRDRVAALKRDHHATRYRASRGKSGLEAARVLREHVRKIRPDWPTARDRDEDFAHHVALKRRIDRAAHAFFAR